MCRDQAVFSGRPFSAPREGNLLPNYIHRPILSCPILCPLAAMPNRKNNCRRSWRLRPGCLRVQLNRQSTCHLHFTNTKRCMHRETVTSSGNLAKYLRAMLPLTILSHPIPFARFSFLLSEPTGVHRDDDRGSRKTTKGVLVSTLPVLVFLSHQDEAACSQLNRLRERKRYRRSSRSPEEEKLLAGSSPTKDTPDGREFGEHTMMSGSHVGRTTT